MSHNPYIYILIMAGVTFAIRVLPLTLVKKQFTNQFVKSFLYYVPYVTLSVMTFPAIINATQSPIAARRRTSSVPHRTVAPDEGASCRSCTVPDGACKPYRHPRNILSRNCDIQVSASDFRPHRILRPHFRMKADTHNPKWHSAYLEKGIRH